MSRLASGDLQIAVSARLSRRSRSAPLRGRADVQRCRYREDSTREGRRWSSVSRRRLSVQRARSKKAVEVAGRRWRRSRRWPRASTGSRRAICCDQITTPFAPNAEQLDPTSTRRSTSCGRRCSPSRQLQATSSGTHQVATASDDLARRTEQQAASLEETAAALDQITADRPESRRRRRIRPQWSPRQGRRREERLGGAQGGRGHGWHREIVAADQPDHRRDRRDRFPDQPARRSTQASRQREPATPAAASRWWPRKCGPSPSARRMPPRKSKA